MQFIMVSDDAYTSVVFYITHIIWHETGENVSDERKKKSTELEKKYIMRHGFVQICSLNAKLYIANTKNYSDFVFNSMYCLNFCLKNVELIALQKLIAYFKTYSMCFRSFLVNLCIRSAL